MKVKRILLAILLALCIALSMTAVTAFAAEANTISSVEITGAKLSYNVGETPSHTASVPDGADYYVTREGWFELDENGKIVDEWTWVIEPNGNADIAALHSWANTNRADNFSKSEVFQFEEGKTYQYVIGVTPNEARPSPWAEGCTLTVNGTPITHDFGIAGMAIVEVTTMTPTKAEKPSNPTPETAKEIQSTGDTKGSIQFANGIDKNYTLDIKKVEVKKDLANKNVKFIADISVMNGSSVVEIKDNKMTIQLALPEDLKGYNKYEVVYIQNDEIKETLPAKVENGYIVFETTHLSQYGIVATNTSASGNSNQGGSTNVNNPQIPKTDYENSIALWSVLLLLGCGAVATAIVGRKKKYNR